MIELVKNYAFIEVLMMTVAEKKAGKSNQKSKC
jgi:hypothetical protein